MCVYMGQLLTLTISEWVIEKLHRLSFLLYMFLHFLCFIIREN